MKRNKNNLTDTDIILEAMDNDSKIDFINDPIVTKAATAVIYSLKESGIKGRKAKIDYIDAVIDYLSNVAQDWTDDDYDDFDE